MWTRLRAMAAGLDGWFAETAFGDKILATGATDKTGQFTV